MKRKWLCFVLYPTINWSFGLSLEQDPYYGVIRLGINFTHYAFGIEIPYGKSKESQE